MIRRSPWGMLVLGFAATLAAVSAHRSPRDDGAARATPCGPGLAFAESGGHYCSTGDRHRSTVSGARLRVASDDGAELVLETQEITRGGSRLDCNTTGVVHAEPALLLSERCGVDEEIRAHAQGLAQAWRFPTRPEGIGDMQVRVAVGGHAGHRRDARGHVFSGPDASSSIRYGTATWIDARGAAREVPVGYDGAELVLTVPAALVEGSAYPAVLDPVISAERRLNAPLVVAPERSQDDPSAASDGTNYLVAWTTRLADLTSDLAISRVTAAGAVLDPLGIQLATAPGSQWDPSVVHAAGRYWVFWLDSRSGTNEIYAARVQSDGTIDDPGGFLVASGDTRTPYAATDGSVLLVIFTVGPSPYDLRGVRVSTSGTVLDATPFLIASDVDFFDYRVAWASGSPGRFVAGYTRDNATFDAEVYLRTVGTDASVSSEVTVALGVDANDIGITSIGSQALLAWADTDNDALQATRVTSAGAILDAPPINLNSSAPGSFSTIDVGQNGSEFVATWRGDPSGIAAARINTSGTVINGADLDITPASGSRVESIASNGTGYLFGLTDTASSTTRSYGLLTSNTLAEQSNPLIAHGANSQNSPAVASDGTNALIAWRDRTDTDSFDIFAARFAPDGTMIDAAPTLIADGAPTTVVGWPSVAFADGVYLVTWTADNSPAHPFQDAYFGALVDPASGAVLSSVDFGVASTGGQRPAVSGASSQFLVLLPGSSELEAARVDRTGILGGGRFQIIDDIIENPQVASDGTGWLAVWDDYGGSVTEQDIRGARIDGTGTVLDTAAFDVSDALGAQREPRVAFDGAQYWVVWRDDTEGFSNYDVRGARVGTDGTVLDTTPVPIATETSRQDDIVIAALGDGFSTFVLWEDFRNGDDSDLFGTFLNGNGSVTTPSGAVVTAEANDDDDAALTALGPGNMMLVYERFEDGLPYRAKRVWSRGLSAAIRGESCATADECAGGHCVDGVCCDSACDGPCERCSDNPGTCEQVTSGDDPGTCEGTSSCNAFGECRKADGESCASASECASNQCIDGVCCDTACGGPCEACTAVLKGSGADGACGPIAADTDPESECDAEPVESCGRTGECSGAGACALYPDGTTCGEARCENGLVSGDVCNGSGSCLSGTTNCAPYDCTATGCYDSCTDDDQCAEGFECGATDECIPTTGLECSADGLQLVKKDGTPVARCHPFLCQGGRCPDVCTSTSECADGHVCDSGTCKPTSSNDSGDDSGCGCRVPAGRGGSGAAWLAAALALTLAQRRRRAQKNRGHIS